MDQGKATGSPTAEIVTPAADAGAHYPLKDIIACMRISAAMLRLADGGNDKNNIGQSRLLLAAANDLETQDDEVRR